ncbi:hypothetical protein [Pontimicrobium sp. SW4]|uniref:YtxH domain-containing protein n=1 Tax=Pontimicrobium sp. SW4 TaxID=3153519 RepID=A0AAU7BX85_9FLAO
MGLDLVIFIAAILLGIFIYWRESNSNKLYKFVNKVFNSKKLRMKSDDKKGFVYKQAFLPRLVYIAAFFLLLGSIIQFLSPFEIYTSYNGISALSSITVGTLIGTYLASFVLKSGKIVDEKSGTITEMVSETIEKGKELLDDITTKDDVEDVVETPKVEDASKEDKKSARERLKDKGLM